MKKKVLVIDDEYDTIKDLFEIIKSKGHTIKGIDNIQQALNTDLQIYDLVILDLVFPPSKASPLSEGDSDMGRRAGLELLKKITEKNQKIPPIVILSARRPDIFEELCKNSGAKKYIHKPVTPYDFWDEIKEYMEN